MEVIALVTLYVDGIAVSPGQTVRISDDEVQSLIDRGFATPVDGDADTKPTTEVSLADVIEAIDLLSPDDFTKDGKPKVPSLIDVLGDDITGELRDRAWEIYQKDNQNPQGGGDNV